MASSDPAGRAGPSLPEHEPLAVVQQFLELLAAGELNAACDLLSDDVEYINVSLPTIRGRERVRSVAHRTLGRPSAGFEVYVHAAAADGQVVLNQRTDVLTFGPLRMQFWVFGRFEVENGQIAVWRDAFDWMNFTAATVRGLAGAVIPALRATPPKVTAGGASLRARRLVTGP